MREDWKFQVFVTKSGGIGSCRKSVGLEVFQVFKLEELEVSSFRNQKWRNRKFQVFVQKWRIGSCRKSVGLEVFQVFKLEELEVSGFRNQKWRNWKFS